MKNPRPFLRLMTACALAAAAFASAPVAASADTTVRGVDISHWQHPNGAGIDFGAVKGAGNSFVIHKATQGTTYTDPSYADDTAAEQAAGLITGAYHFPGLKAPLSSAVDEANYYLSVTGTLDAPNTLPPILDFEADSCTGVTGGAAAATNTTLTMPQLVTWAQLWLETVQAKTGRTPVIYTYPWFYHHCLGDSPALAGYPLWYAAYNANPPTTLAGWTNWVIWQNSASGTIPGIPGAATDTDVWGGDLASLTAFADGTHPAAPVVAAPSSPLKLAASYDVHNAQLSWLPGKDGGEVPSSYTVSGGPNGPVTVSGTTFSASVGGLVGGTTYTFTVTAANSAGSSPPSVPLAVTPAAAPAIPTGFETAAWVNQVTLTWSPSSGSPTSYNVYRCSPLPCIPTGVPVASVPGTQTSYVDTAVTAGVGYLYAMTAQNSFGESEQSSYSYGKPLSTEPPNGFTKLDKPLRLADTRIKLGGSTLDPNGVLVLNPIEEAGLTGHNITAVVVNLSVVAGPAGGTYLSAYPSGGIPPRTSSVNVGAGGVAAATVVVGLGPDGTFSVRNGPGAGTNVVVDMVGYLQQDFSATTYHSTGSPLRIIDSRIGKGLSGPLTGTAVKVNLSALSGVVPQGATAVVNLTVTGSDSAGWLAAYPGNEAYPGTSNLNYAKGQTVANRAFVATAPDGTIYLRNSSHTVQVVVDLVGFFAPDAAAAQGTAALDSAGLSYTALPAPVRVCDTRSSCGSVSGPVGPRTTIPVQVMQGGVLPNSAKVAVITLTTSDASADSYLKSWDGTGVIPGTSDLNMYAHEEVANLALVTISGTGTIGVYNSSGTANVIVDVLGYLS